MNGKTVVPWKLSWLFFAAALIWAKGVFAFDQEPVQTAAKDGFKGAAKTVVEEDCKYTFKGDKWRIEECDREEWIYDSLGNKLEYRRFNDKGELQDRMVYKYADGRLTEILDLNEHGGLDERQVFVYGNNGQLVESQEYNSDNILQKRFVEYKMDAAGNAIQYIGIRVNGFRVDDRERTLRRRKIDYYPAVPAAGAK